MEAGLAQNDKRLTQNSPVLLCVKRLALSVWRSPLNREIILSRRDLEHAAILEFPEFGHFLRMAALPVF
jgi:hypothetical protein